MEIFGPNRHNKRNRKEINMFVLYLFAVFAILLFVNDQSAEAFILQQSYDSSIATKGLFVADNGNKPIISETAFSNNSNRRHFMSTIATVPFVTLWNTQLISSTAASANEDVSTNNKKEKILVLGGSGFVGSQVVKELQQLGITVIATSRDGRDNTIAFDATKNNDETSIQKLLSSNNDITAIISCIGSIGTQNDEIVNSASGVVAKAAKSAGTSSSVKRFVYIGVAPEVKDFASNIEFLNGYMKGKESSQSMILSSFGNSDSTFIQPTFIYGGDTFNINPPRVASFYGQFIEGLLSSQPIRTIESILPSGIIKIALEPPISVNNIAKVNKI